MAVVTAILSSDADISIAQNFCFAAEIGLAGEIRPVQKIEQRISEAEKLGFEKIFVSKFTKFAGKKFSIEVILVSKIEEIYEQLF